MDVKASDRVRNVLVVADWSVDPYGIVAACRRTQSYSCETSARRLSWSS